MQFECKNAGQPLITPQCVATYNKCDGIAHCKDGSDELNCPSPQVITDAPSSKLFLSIFIFVSKKFNY